MTFLELSQRKLCGIGWFHIIYNAVRFYASMHKLEEVQNGFGQNGSVL